MYSEENLSFLALRGKIFRGIGRTPLIQGRWIASIWRDCGMEMYLGDSGGIWPLGVVVIVVALDLEGA